MIVLKKILNEVAFRLPFVLFFLICGPGNKKMLFLTVEDRR